jgi:hypothetical protein
MLSELGHDFRRIFYAECCGIKFDALRLCRRPPAPWRGEAPLAKPHQPLNQARRSQTTLNFDLFGFGFFVLRQMHLEHAVLELSLYSVRVPRPAAAQKYGQSCRPRSTR